MIRNIRLLFHLFIRVTLILYISCIFLFMGRTNTVHMSGGTSHNDFLSIYLQTFSNDHSSYDKRYLKPAPRNFRNWLKLVEQFNCSKDLSYYDQIVRDLSNYFIGSIVPKEEYIFNSESSTGTFTNGSFSSNNGVMNDIFGNWTHTITRKSFFLTFNDWDMPRMVPSATAFEGSRILVDINNECVRKTYSQPVIAKYNYFLRTGVERSRSGYIYTDKSKHLIISQAKAPCFQDLLLPMGYDWDTAKESITDDIPFKLKISALVWRGSNTGAIIDDGEDWHNFIRIRILFWEKEFRDKYPSRIFTSGLTEANVSEGFAVDIALNRHSGLCEKSGRSGDRCPYNDLFINSFPTKPSLSFDEIKQYKYLLVLDGNSWPSRLQKMLHFNSVILYPRLFFNWYSWYLQPFVHFVPVNLDLSDLEEKVEWLESNPVIAENIAKNANYVIRILSRKNQMICHAGFALVHLNDLMI